ncbi:riboflavin kinase/FMN adenylyltransferase [Dehalogenimonas alkenigignens]|uniref:Riboflavin biosynthesis protein n=2 Tax=Dehalogenimonas alkenigignens TaxID=1217799 RepID=A0A0W0GIX1_9CHLR|nr:riboflavin kinase/FMN adenylyltransferase [Dehalogenimonas alkenigignens]
MVLTIGVFDGVHLGHQALIAETISQAKRIGALSGVVTFAGHPRQVLGMHKELPHLTSLDRRITLLKSTGVDLVITLVFTEELASLPALEFIRLLKKYLSLTGLVVGPDFALGKGREGDIASLRAMGELYGFNLIVVPPQLKAGHKVSSTLVRKAMAESNMKKVHDLLGRCFSLEGNVIRGEGRGAKLGFPTANLEIAADQALPADGVYATIASINGQRIPSITNIGTRPTFGAGNRTVETHLLDFSGQLYGHRLEIAIIEQIRPEEKFASPDKLLKQIKEDVAKARQVLKKTECV